MTKMVDIDDTQETWADLITLAQTGTEVILAKSGKPLARIEPIEAEKEGRIMGLHRGQAWMSDDFDAPMTDEFTEGKL